MNIIAFKIAAQPLQPEQINIDLLGYVNSFACALAFTIMLQDCLQAALHGNLADDGPKAVNVGLLPSGFLGEASVLNLQDGLATIQNLISRLGLTGQCEIATRSLFQKTFQHYSGPDYGPIEANFAESAKFTAAFKEAAKQMPPPNPPLPL